MHIYINHKKSTVGVLVIGRTIIGVKSRHVDASYNDNGFVININSVKTCNFVIASFYIQM